MDAINHGFFFIYLLIQLYSWCDWCHGNTDSGDGGSPQSGRGVGGDDRRSPARLPPRYHGRSPRPKKTAVDKLHRVLGEREAGSVW